MKKEAKDESWRNNNYDFPIISQVKKEDLSRRKNINRVLWSCLLRPSYPNSSLTACLASVFNYLFSFVG